MDGERRLCEYGKKELRDYISSAPKSGHHGYEDAVAKALSSGKISAAGVDVVSREPMDPSNSLLHAPNCIITPHISWAAMECRRRIVDITAGNIRGYLTGTPQNVVNP